MIKQPVTVSVLNTEGSSEFPPGTVFAPIRTRPTHYPYEPLMTQEMLEIAGRPETSVLVADRTTVTGIVAAVAQELHASLASQRLLPGAAVSIRETEIVFMNGTLHRIIVGVSKLDPDVLPSVFRVLYCP